MTAPALDRESLKAELLQKFPGASTASAEVKGFPTLRLASAESLIPVLRWLKDERGFGYLDMVAATDWKGPVDLDGYIREPNPNVFLPEGATPQIAAPTPGKDVPYRESFELIYLLSNLNAKLKLIIKLDAPRVNGSVPSIVSVFKSADWQEREIFDLFGLRFDGHPNLKKILTPDFIEGYPLRKDYKHKKDRFDA